MIPSAKGGSGVVPARLRLFRVPAHGRVPLAVLLRSGCGIATPLFHRAAPQLVCAVNPSPGLGSNSIDFTNKRIRLVSRGFWGCFAADLPSGEAGVGCLGDMVASGVALARSA